MNDVPRESPEDSKPLKCCANKCLSTIKDSDKHFFKFPLCTASNSQSYERSRKWVQRSGNAELLQYKLSDLTKNFYLCSDHFDPALFSENTKELISDNAVPSLFSCDPLSEEDMKSFPVSVETEPEDEPISVISSKAATSTNPSSEATSALQESNISDGHLQEKLRNDKSNLDDAATSICDTDRRSANVSTELEDGPPNNCDISDVVETQAKVVAKKSRSKSKTWRTEPQRSTPSRKAKQDAVSKLSNQQNVNREESIDEDCKSSGDEPVRKLARTQNVCKGGVSSADEALHESSREKASAKIKSPPSKKAKRSVLLVRRKTSGESRKEPENLTISEDKALTSHSLEQAKQSMPIVEGGTLQSNSRSTADSQKLVSQEFVANKLVSLPCHRKKIKISANGNKISFNGYNIKKKIGFRNDGSNAKNCNQTKSISSQDSSELSVLRVSRTVFTQTYPEKPLNVKEILKILDSDQKLFVMSGISSFEVLDSLSDAILKMVMNSAVMIHDMEPVLRVWIILTCTKFRLSISFQVLSVLFQMDEEEISRIVEKTSLFLRKALSLPDCQKYIMVLPSEVLDGISDFSDTVLSQN